VERIEKIKNQIVHYIDMKELRLSIEDKNPHPFGKFIPEKRFRDVKVMGPRDYLPSARSVITVGIHYPYTCLSEAEESPAKTIAPYGFAQFATLHQLNMVSLDIVKFLMEKGYQAISTLDLFNIASRLKTPRGLIVDNTANSYIAVASGLGDLAWNGMVLTPEYGFTQRFIAIVTDAPLNSDPVYDGEPLCNKCFQCVENCPTQALSKEKGISIEIDGKKFIQGCLERLRCDWSKRYGLIAEAGPKYMGCELSLKPPRREISSEDIMEAVQKLDPFQKYFVCVLERCIKACPRKFGNKKGEQSKGFR